MNELFEALNPPNPARPVFVLPGSTRLRDVDALVGAPHPRFVLISGAGGRVVGVLDRESPWRHGDDEAARRSGPADGTEPFDDRPIGHLALPLDPPPGPFPEEADPRTAWVRNAVAAAPVHDADGVAALVVDGRLFVDWRRVAGVIARSEIDAVTGLPCRRPFEKRLHEEIQRAARSGIPLALLALDVDRFKRINDQYGHPVGDAALRRVAARLKSGVRAYDMVARVGGDEFAVICPGCPPSDVPALLARLRAAIVKPEPNDPHDPSIAGSPELTPTVSIGAALLAGVDHGCSAAELLAQADACLYSAKRSGRSAAFTIVLDRRAAPLAAPTPAAG